MNSRLTFLAADILRYRIWPFVVAMCIFLLSSQNFKMQLPAPGLGDKLIHVAVYALLGWTTARALMANRNLSTTWKWIALAMALSVAFGVTDEVHQMFVPGRFPSVADALANLVGAVIGALIYKTKSKKPLPEVST